MSTLLEEVRGLRSRMDSLEVTLKAMLPTASLALHEAAPRLGLSLNRLRQLCREAWSAGRTEILAGICIERVNESRARPRFRVLMARDVWLARSYWKQEAAGG